MLSSRMASKGNLSIVLPRWAPHVFLIRKNILVVGDWMQSWYLILGILFALPFFANI